MFIFTIFLVGVVALNAGAHAAGAEDGISDVVTFETEHVDGELSNETTDIDVTTSGIDISLAIDADGFIGELTHSSLEGETANDVESGLCTAGLDDDDSPLDITVDDDGSADIAYDGDADGDVDNRSIEETFNDCTDHEIERITPSNFDEEDFEEE